MRDKEYFLNHIRAHLSTDLWQENESKILALSENLEEGLHDIFQAKTALEQRSRLDQMIHHLCRHLSHRKSFAEAYDQSIRDIWQAPLSQAKTDPSTIQDSQATAENPTSYNLKDFILTLVSPMLITKSMAFFFGLKMSEYPGEGYGYGLTLCLSLTVFTFVRFIWVHRKKRDVS